MKIDALLTLEPDSELTISNEPFTYSGKASVTLEGGDALVWLFQADGAMLAISPSDEELMFYRQLDEALEPENETIGWQGKEYEFSYEDVGSVTDAEGDCPVDSDERYGFSDYESSGGERIRLVRNDSTGDVMTFVGVVVGEEDVVLVE